MDLSVVIASIESARSIDRCLAYLERSCAGLASEFIVVDSSRDDAAVRAVAHGRQTIVIRCAPETLAPELWATGYRRSTGRVVAFTTGHCLVSEGWAGALLQALDAGATGAGGPIVIGGGTSPLDWAIYYLRYAAMMPHELGTGRVMEIAGDNAAYQRTALDRHAEAFSRGFWEIDFHKLVKADGGWLAAAPGAVTEFSRSFSLTTILRQRFVHGRHCGAGRVRGGARAAWQVMMAAPLVPFVLAARAAASAAKGTAPWRFVVALPWFLLLAGAWAAGEGWGAMHVDAGLSAAERST